MIRVTHRHPSKTVRALLVVLALALCWGTYRVYKELTMPPVFVYLIPEHFIGPVFVFFGQKDGVLPEPDPLGQAVRVPENGVVKLSLSVDKLIRPSSAGRSEAHVRVDRNGQRQTMKIFTGPHPEGGTNKFWEGYLDGTDQFHKFEVDYINNNAPPKLEPFHYFSDSLMKERMIFGQQGCRHQEFSPSREESPECAKFLVASPREFTDAPDWLWERAGRTYGSMDKFMVDANKRVQLKRDFYDKPATP